MMRWAVLFWIFAPWMGCDPQYKCTDTALASACGAPETVGGCLYQDGVLGLEVCSVLEGVESVLSQEDAQDYCASIVGGEPVDECQTSNQLAMCVVTEEIDGEEITKSIFFMTVFLPACSCSKSTVKSSMGCTVPIFDGGKRVMFSLFCGVVFGGCSADSKRSSIEKMDLDSSVSMVNSSQCLDQQQLETCQAGECVVTTCRLDEICSDDACSHWREQVDYVDFSLDVDVDGIACEVEEGGFPDQWAEFYEYRFGDLHYGVGSQTTHAYAQPGIYPIWLEVSFDENLTLRQGRLAVIEPVPDDWMPLQLTLNSIPNFLNGSIPFSSNADSPDDPTDDVEEAFHLFVPSYGFEVDVEIFSDELGSSLKDNLHLMADVDIGEGSVLAGTDLASFLEFEDADYPKAKWTVPPELSFPLGMVRLTLSSMMVDGTAVQQTLDFEIMELSPEFNPMEQSSDWLLLVDRDLFQTTGEESVGGGIGILTQAGEDGKADFLAELELFGAQGEDIEANAIYLGWIVGALVEELNRFYHLDSQGRNVNGRVLHFYLEGEEGAPSADDFDEGGSFSMIRLGGELVGSDGEPQYLGYSHISWYNDKRVDNSNSHHGIATGTLLNVLLTTPVVLEEFDAILPQLGSPVGMHPLDSIVLSPTFDEYDPQNPQEQLLRHQDLRRIARLIARPIAGIVAHELGHAMGLMPNDVPPAGFFGNRPDVSFMGDSLTFRNHADFPGFNLMQGGGDFLGTLVNMWLLTEVPEDYEVIQIYLAFLHLNRMSSYSKAYFEEKLSYER